MIHTTDPNDWLVVEGPTEVLRFVGEFLLKSDEDPQFKLHHQDHRFVVSLRDMDLWNMKLSRVQPCWNLKVTKDDYNQQVLNVV